MLPLVLFCSLVAQVVTARTLTIKNSCSGAIWPAVIGNKALTSSSGSVQPGGWEQGAGASVTFVVGDDFSGRIWARTGGCNGDVKKCKIGSCDNGALECHSSGSAGATLAEFSLSGSTGADYYDVSIVDGFSVPMKITPSDPSCAVAACSPDLLESCDPSLVWPSGSDKIYACAMPCTAGVQFTTLGAPNNFISSNSPSCCTGKWLGQANCTPNLIPFYQTYKSMCKNSYIYPDDDGVGSTAVFGCGSKAKYTVEFCPEGVGSGLDSPLPASSAKEVDAGGQINVARAGNAGGGASAAPTTATTASTTTSPTITSTTSSTDHIPPASSQSRTQTNESHSQTHTGSKHSPSGTATPDSKKGSGGHNFIAFGSEISTSVLVVSSANTVTPGAPASAAATTDQKPACKGKRYKPIGRRRLSPLK